MTTNFIFLKRSKAVLKFLFLLIPPIFFSLITKGQSPSCDALIIVYGATGTATIGQQALLNAFGPLLLPTDVVSVDSDPGSVNNVATGKAYQNTPLLTRIRACSASIISNISSDAAIPVEYIDFDIEAGLCTADANDPAAAIQAAVNAIHNAGMKVIIDIATPYATTTYVTQFAAVLTAGDIFKIQATGQQQTDNGFLSYVTPLINAARSAGYIGMPIVVQVSVKAENANQNPTRSISCLKTIVNQIDGMMCFYDQNNQTSLDDCITVYDWWRNNKCVATHISKEAQKKLPLIVYPNPSHDNFFVVIPSEIIIKDAIMKIYDVCGKEVKMVSINSNQTTINRGTLQSGIYFYSIINNNKNIANGKLLVQD